MAKRRHTAEQVVNLLRQVDGLRYIGVLHLLLLEHPLVLDLIARGYEICSAEECVNEVGVSARFICLGTWWHAVDLIHSHPSELLAMR